MVRIESGRLTSKSGQRELGVGVEGWVRPSPRAGCIAAVTSRAEGRGECVAHGIEGVVCVGIGIGVLPVSSHGV